jgi:hypothetical protein
VLHDLSNSEIAQRIQHRTSLDFEEAMELVKGWRRGESEASAHLEEILHDTLR